MAGFARGMAWRVAFALAVITPTGCAPPTRSPPDAADVARIQSILGLDAWLEAALKEGLQPLAGQASAAQRECVASKLKAAIAPAMSDQVGQLFETRRNIDAWSAFNATPEGGKLLVALRARIVAQAAGGSPPSIKDVVSQLEPAERERAERFFRSDAGRVITKGLPSADALLAPVRPQFPMILQICGVIP